MSIYKAGLLLCHLGDINNTAIKTRTNIKAIRTRTRIKTGAEMEPAITLIHNNNTNNSSRDMEDSMDSRTRTRTRMGITTMSSNKWLSRSCLVY